MTNPHRFSNEEELEDYLVARPELLGGIVVRRQPLTPCNGQPDVLVLTSTATLVCVEVKRSATSEKTLGQILDYAYWGDELTMEELTKLADQNATPIDLAYEFKKRFGRSLPDRLNGTPRLTLIAATFDRRTLFGLHYLRRRGVPIQALRYVEDQGSIAVLPFTVEDLAREHRESLHERASASGAMTVRWLPSIYAVHEDVRRFWERFSSRFIWDFVPFSFLGKLYEAWRQAEELAGHPRARHQWGQFGRQLSQLARESDEWTYHPRFRPGALMDAFEPLVDEVATWTRAARDHPVAGYLRKSADGQ